MKKILCGALFLGFICANAAQKDDWHDRLVQLNTNPKNKKRLASFRRKSTGNADAKAERKFTELREPEPDRTDNLRRSGSLK
jgi:hypothetical protein